LNAAKNQESKPLMLVIDDDPVFRAEIRHFFESNHKLPEYDSPVLIEAKNLLQAGVAARSGQPI
jgi:DNA-binding NarL/FixJ family response regulator